MQNFNICINEKINKNKPTEDEAFGYENWELIQKTVSIEDLANCLAQGMTVCPMCEDDAGIYYDLLIFDIDNNDKDIISKDRAISNFRDIFDGVNPIISYPTFSDDGSYTRFRLIYLLESSLDKDDYRGIYSLTSYHFKFIDSKCRHAKRLFFGTNKSVDIVSEDFISNETIESLLGRYESEKEDIANYFTRKMFKVPGKDLAYEDIELNYYLTDYAYQNRNIYELIRSKISAFDLIQEMYGRLDYLKHSHGNMYRCPIHGGDHGDNLKYYEATDSFTCFSECDMYFDCVTLLQIKYNTTKMLVVYYKAVKDGYIEELDSMYIQKKPPIKNRRRRKENRGSGEEAPTSDEEEVTIENCADTVPTEIGQDLQGNECQYIVWAEQYQNGAPMKTYSNFSRVLDFKNIYIKRENISKMIEVSDPFNNLDGYVEGNAITLEVTIKDLCTKQGLSLSKQDIKDFIETTASNNEYNYLIQLSEEYYNEDISIIREYFDCLIFDEEYKDYLEFYFTSFEIFLVSLLRLQENSLISPRQMEFLIALLGEQGIGKSYWLKNLFNFNPKLVKSPFTPNLKGFDAMDKTFRAVQKHILVELAEIDGVLDVDTCAELKNILIGDSDAFHKLHVGEQLVPRHYAYAATSNNINILMDRTGNRRFVCWLGLKSIDQEKENKIDTKKLWGAVAYLRDTKYKEYKNKLSIMLPKEYQKMQSELNDSILYKSELDELIEELFDWDIPKEKWRKVWSKSEVVNFLKNNYKGSCKIGIKTVEKALESKKIEKKDYKHNKNTIGKRTGYLLPPTIIPTDGESRE